MEIFQRLYKSGAGAIVSKSLSTKPWDGYHNPTFVGLDNGGWINAVGLSNPGAREFANIIKGNKDVPMIVSLVGSEPSDFAEMISRFDTENITAYELNLSCPHVAKVGLEVGDDLELVSNIISVAKSASNVPIIVKVGLGSTDYLSTVETAIKAGADAITAINTLRAMAIDVETQNPVLSNVIGGMSGSPIKPVAIRCVYEITDKFDIPVIGCGGISSWTDATEFILAGASAVQVGSAIGDDGMDIFKEINDGLLRYMDRKGFDSIMDMVGSVRKS
ncbi:MAG: dihydroorotate dehydrogenase [Cenarchaeum symbiont of Oopsacas minuta]|nr:dihydroorotate dehydrogenase [Cenarchaeum symbiont of Oopsacas minuta]